MAAFPLLRDALALIKRSQSDLARHLGVSPASVTLMVKFNRWPKGHGGEFELRARIVGYLIEHGVPTDVAYAALNEAPPATCGNTTPGAAADAAISGPPTNLEDPYMLLRKHTINREARQHFRIARDPFTDEMESDADVFLSDDIRHVRASMRMTAKHGGMLAVVAESGGGKSTLRHDLADWVQTSREPITIIEPYVIGMEDSDKKGKPLKSADITGAVIRTVSPGTPLRATYSDRAAQMHNILKQSAQVGRKHVLIIEEAHALATPTIKHLKRFYELQDGFKKLLAIILIGQTELEWKLSEHNPEVREVVQRCEMVKLPPLDNHIEAYLRHKLQRVELDYDALIATDAVEAIRGLLRHTVTEASRSSKRESRVVSLCHPLAINNLVSAAMNEAVKIGAPKVTGALITAAVRA